MSNNGKIYIVVTDKLPGGVGPSPVPTPTKPDNEEDSSDPNSLFAHWAKNQLLSTAKQTALSAVHYSLNNVGNFTGDYITQTQINNTLHNLNSVKSIAMSAIAGFKVGGVPGLLMATSLSILNTGISSFYQIHSMEVQNVKTNYEIQQLTKRAGLNSTYDGSRGTEN